MSGCLHCGTATALFKSGKPKKFCGIKCAEHFHAKKRHVPQGQRKKQHYPNRRKPRPCAYCSAIFLPKTGSRVYCSRSCSIYARSHASPNDRAEELSALRLKPCIACGVLSETRKHRCVACAKAHYVAEWKRHHKKRYPWYGEAARPCQQCGSVFERATKASRICPTCLAATQKRLHKQAKYRRRARMLGLTAENFDPLDVMERDHWRCQDCGLKTRRDVPTAHDHYPTLDHIIPLSKGGAHTRANTRCLCRACNIAKSDRLVPVQQRLFA